MKTRLDSRFAMGLNRVKLIMLAITLGLCCGVANFADAQEAKATKPTEKKKTNIDFEDELIEGEMKKPELFYLLQKKQFNFKRLIKLRDDFLPEMRRDADEIRRSRSKN